jgi:hypothetical protein
VKTSLTLGGLLLGSVAIFLGQFQANAVPGDGDGGTASVGPDVIVGAIPDVASYGSTTVGGVVTRAYAFGTTSCNIGTVNLDWYASPSNQHPFIPMNMYRYYNGRLEQIGISWGKHGFCALQQTLCGTCTPAGGGCPSLLGVGCSDPYSASLNGSQGDLGWRKEVNAATGAFPGTFNSGAPSAPATIGRRLQVAQNDLASASFPGALYVAEGQYIHPDDAASGNDDNNASWRQFTVSATYAITLTGATKQQQPAISSWKQFNPAVNIVNVDVANDGRFVVGFYAKDNGNGTWRYEYAIQNLNSDRSGQSFSVPIPAGVTVSNIGFKDINYHSGEPYANTDWTSSVSGGQLTWQTQTYATNQNANALRFSTMYNFWFDADEAPSATNVSTVLGLFKPGASGAPNSVSFATQGPATPVTSIPGDFNNDGVVNGADLSTLLNSWGTAGGDLNGDGNTDGADLAILLGNWTL